MKKLLISAFALFVMSCFALGASAGNSSEIVCNIQDFEAGTEGWSVHEDCQTECVLSQETVETQALAATCGFDPAKEYDHATAAIIKSAQLGWTVNDATHIALDVYTDAAYDTDYINITPFYISSGHDGRITTAGTNFPLNGNNVFGGLRKHTVSVSLTGTDGTTPDPKDIIDIISIVASGVKTSYSGKIYFDNLRLVKYGVIEPEEFNIADVNIKNSWKLVKNEQIFVSCKAVGKEAPYNYTVYALKDGCIKYKSAVRSDSPSVSFTLPEAGEYTILLYCQSSNDAKTLKKYEKNITIYDRTEDVPKLQKAVALTFDDGPDSDAGELLDVLKEKDVHATFFVLYSNGACNPTLIKRAYDEGHQIGNHTYSHDYLTTMPREQAIFEIEYVNDFLQSITGERPHVYRPPYLVYNQEVLSYFPDMTSITCSVDSRDWAGLTKEQLVNKVINSTANGDIILMHEPQPNTRAAIGEIIDYFQSIGYECVTVDELFERRNIEMLPGVNYTYGR